MHSNFDRSTNDAHGSGMPPIAEDLEGIVGKRSDSVYSAGTTADWVTIETPGGVERGVGRRGRLG